jgi:hypothetical protein
MLEPDIEILKRIKISELDPTLKQEVTELVQLMGHESAIRSSDSLDLMYTLYRAEKAKERKNRKVLKQAEDMIMRLSSLHYESTAARQRESGDRLSGVRSISRMG